MNTDVVTIKLPVHLRYQSPSHASHAEVKVLPPLVYARCRGNLEFQSVMTVPSTVPHVVTTVPVGQVTHHLLVTVVTLLVTTAGATSVIFTLFCGNGCSKAKDP